MVFPMESDFLAVPRSACVVCERDRVGAPSVLLSSFQRRMGNDVLVIWPAINRGDRTYEDMVFPMENDLLAML